MKGIAVMSKREAEPTSAVIVGPAPYVTQEVAAVITGYSVKAIIRKREEGHWLEGREWVRATSWVT